MWQRRAFLKAARAAAQALCESRFVAFGCEGMADRIRPVPLEAMARRYSRARMVA
jgi:fructose-bisphosphate aldolase class II